MYISVCRLKLTIFDRELQSYVIKFEFCYLNVTTLRSGIGYRKSVCRL